MLSNRPYLLRAFYDWIVDSSCTPILVINAAYPRCKVPEDYVEGNEIVFNISASAVRNLKLGNEIVEFKASFSGVIHVISAPVKSILAIYAEENGEGIFFDANELDDEDTGESHIIKTPENLISLKSIEGNQKEVPAHNPAGSKVKPFLTIVE